MADKIDPKDDTKHNNLIRKLNVLVLHDTIDKQFDKQFDKQLDGVMPQDKIKGAMVKNPDIYIEPLVLTEAQVDLTKSPKEPSIARSLIIGTFISTPSKRQRISFLETTKFERLYGHIDLISTNK